MTFPASAAAVDRYVDNSPGFGDNSAPCTDPTDPCVTIAFALALSGPGDTIFVGGNQPMPATYAGNFTLPGGVSLVRSDFDGPGSLTDGAAIIDGGNEAGVHVANGAAREVRGFTIRGGDTTILHQSMLVSGDADVTIAENVFDDPTLVEGVRLQTSAGDGTVSVIDNTFDGTDDGMFRAGIATNNDSIEIAGNEFTDFFNAIQVVSGTDSGEPSIHDNTITGVYDTPSPVQNPAGIFLGDAGGVIADNLIVSAPGQIRGAGIFLNFNPPDPGPALSLRRNRIFGFPEYGFRQSAEVPVSMRSDVLAKNATGILAFGQGGLTLDGVTVTDSTAGGPLGEGEIVIFDSPLTLRSSIVGAEGIAASGAGSSCSISFSRGPAIGADDCSDFATTADPLFVAPGSGDYHLQAGSPLIDMGDPQKPGKTHRDLDNEKRAVDGTGSCLGNARRDIGADEFECVPPNTKITKGPSGQTEDRSPTFKFRSSGTGSTFECRLDAKPFKPCSSPKTYGKQDFGRHAFRVRATDPEANVDPTPAKRSFKVVH